MTTWYANVNYVPSGGPVSASAALGAIPGFSDINGSSWSIDASNNLLQVASNNNPWATRGLFRNGTVDRQFQGKISVTMTWHGTDNLQLIPRAKTPTAGSTLGYMVSFDAGGGFTFKYVSGTAVFTPSGTPSQTAGPVALVSGTQYVCVASAEQTNSTTTTLTATMYAADGVTVINSATCTDTTSWLQNTPGGQGFAINGLGTQATFQNVTTFTDVNNNLSTSYTLALPTTGNSVGNAMGGSVTLNGGNALNASLSVALSDGASGVFSPNPVVVTTGTNVVNFTYTPATAGTQTVTWTHTGGNGGMTGDGNESIVVAAGLTQVLTNDAACIRSPYNWEQGSAGASSVQSFYAGAYLRFYITGCTSINILCDGSNTLGYINWQIDSGSLLNKVQIPSGGVISGIAIPDTGPHVVTIAIDSWPAGNAGRWASTGFVGLQGIQIVGSGAAANPSAAVAGTNRILILGDSITEGLRAYQNSAEIDGAEFAWSTLVGKALQQLTTAGGWEYGISGCSSQGYTITGTGGMVPVFTPGNDGQSSWNKVTAATSRLSGGQFIQQPTVILDNHGENDFLQNVGAGTVQTAIQGLYTAMRTAAPAATLVGLINFGGGLRASKIAGINAFIAATGDTNTKIIDLAIDNRFTSTTFSGDGIHIQPTAAGQITARLVPQLLTALGLIGTSGGGGGGSTPTVFPAAYATTVSGGTNYEAAQDVTLEGPAGSWTIRRGDVIKNLAQAKRLLAAGIPLLPHP